MRRFFSCLMIVPAIFLACSREMVQEDEPMRFERVQINIGEESQAVDAETRSLVTIDGVEKFVKAALFAFDSNGHIIVNTSAQNPYALAITTTSQAFEWDLPVNTDLKIYVLENYGDLNISGLLNNTSLTVSDLETLMFTCSSSSALAALETGGKGMPMSGVNSVRLQSGGDPVNITVGKLFARYNFKLDVSAYTSLGYSVNGVFVKAMKSNTEVPFFVSSAGGTNPVPSGYKQTDYSKLQVVDTNSQDDLVTLDAGGYVTLYFLENCQGLIYPSGSSPASSWRTIYQDFKNANALNKIANCSYIEFGVKVSKSSGEDETFTQRVYLGDDMRNNKVSNFNVRRNVMQTLAISLSPSVTAPPTEAFRFDHSQTLVVTAGEDVTVSFGWNGFDQSDLEFETSNSNLTEKTSSRVTNGGPITIGGQTYPNSGHATFTASSTANGVSVKITGGKNLGDDDQVYDQISVAIQQPILLEDISVRCTVMSVSEYIYGGMTHTSTIGGTGEDMNIPVDSNDGNTCYVALWCRAKYNGEWHDVEPGDELVKYSVNDQGYQGQAVSSWVSHNYSFIDTDNASTYCWEDWFMPGDYQVIQYLFNGEVAASFRINYGSSGSSPATEVFQDIQVNCEATVMGNSYSQGNTFSSAGEDMQILVDAGGNYVTYIVTGQVKYDDVWHDLTTDSHTHLSIGSTQQSWTFTTGTKIYSGTTTLFQVYYGTALVKSWSVTAVQAQDEILFDIDCEVSESGRTVHGDGNSDINFGVSSYDVDVTVSVTGRIYYNGAWHNVRTDNNLKCYSDGSLQSSWYWTYQQTSGDSETVSIKLNGTTIKSWTIYY